MTGFIDYIPVFTTILSIVFFAVLFKHWKERRKKYLFWWMLGVLCYGLGTLTESLVTFFGWHEIFFKAWYILGALLGGAPLAQGTVYLFIKDHAADWMTFVLVSVLVITAVLVLFSPINHEAVRPYYLSGDVLVWKRIRLITPFINIYAFIFLVGGAMYSAIKYSKDRQYRNRFIGNICIAVGGILPGIGGIYTKAGLTEVLYVTEFLGIILIYLGYIMIRRDPTLSLYSVQRLD